MRRTIIFALSLIAMLIYLVNSCMEESVEWLFDEEKEKLINEAKSMYYNLTAGNGLMELLSSNGNGNGNGNNGNGNNGNGNGNNGNGNGNNGNGNNGNDNGNNGNVNGNGYGNSNKNLAVKPSWDYTSIEQDNTYQAVEILLQMETVFNFVTPESSEKFKNSKKHEYISSKTSLIYLVHKKTGDVDMFLMTIIPAISYLESTKFDPFKKMSYLKRDKKFNGSIIFHNMNGEFVNGWNYTDGEVTATIDIKTKTNDFDLVELRSTTCTTIYWEVYYEFCWQPGYYYSGEIMWGNINCSYSDYSYYYYEQCNTSGGDGNYNGGGGGGGGNSGQSLPTQVILSGKPTITIMDSYSLIVTITPSNYSPKAVIFKINNQYELQKNSSTTCNEKAKKAGNWAIKAIVDGYESNIYNVNVQFPEIGQIRAQSVIMSAMNAAWSSTRAATTQNSRREEGFSIYVNNINGNTLTYEVGTTCTGSPVSCGTTATIAISRNETTSSSPLNGGKYCVAQFHTHTPFTYCSKTLSRNVGPSGSDSDSFCPQLIFDYSAGPLVGGHNINDGAQIYTLGSRRTQY